MPIFDGRTTLNDTTDTTVFQVFGVQAPPPAAPTAPPTLGTAPTVSSTPTPGQGIATDSSGRIAPTVAAQAIPVFTADPTSPVVGQIWYRSDTSQLSIRHDAGTTKRVLFS